MIQSRTFYYLIGLAAGFVATFLVVALPQTSFAAIGSGGGTPGTPTSGGAHTRHGHGWYRFGINEQGPANISGSSLTWPMVQNICRGESATHVLAYLMLRGTGGVYNAAVVGAYFPENWNGFMGNSGGSWRNSAYAIGVFNALPASQRIGYRIAPSISASGDVASGVGPGRGNVGWLCDGISSTNFSTTGTTTVNRTTMAPGETAQWTHTLRNDGPSASTSIRSHTINTGFANPDFNGTRNINIAEMPAGYTRWHAAYSTYTATAADAGNTLCQQLQWDPVNSSGAGNGRANNACVTVVANPWSTSASTTRTVNGTVTGVGNPGQVIRWTHTLNLHQGQNHVPIRSQTFSSGFSNGWNGVAVAETTPAGRSVGTLRSIGSSVTNRTQYTIAQSDVGSTLCQQLQWDPTNSGGGRDGRTPDHCVQVLHDYALVPTITSPGERTIVESDTRPVSVTGRITNNGPTKSSPNINWQMTQIVYSPGVTTIPNQVGGDGTSPCSFFTGGSSCNSIGSGTEVNGFGFGTPFHATNNPESSRTYSGAGSMNDNPPGTKICYAMSVQPFSTTGLNWRHSRLHCLIVGKDPKVQVWGGSVQSGRTFGSGVNNSADIAAGSTTKLSDGLTYGSWSEYGALATGEVRRFASGSGLNATNGGHMSSAQSQWSGYTFTRIGANYGDYVFSNTTLPDITRVFPTSSAIGVTNFNLSSLASGIPKHIRPAGSIAAGSNIVLQSGAPITLNSGQWLVVNAIGYNVTIADDLRYATGPFTDASQVPQLIIIADNITINSNVTQVDAWLIARSSSGGATGAIATCDQQSGGIGSSNNVAQWLGTAPIGNTSTNYTVSANSRLTIDHCNSQLRINGPVIANKLYLRRTAGSESGSGSSIPAEIINLRPDAYLWAKEYMSPALIYSSVSETELPPRY